MVNLFSCASLVIWLSSLKDTDWHPLPLSLGIYRERRDCSGKEHWRCDGRRRPIHHPWTWCKSACLPSFFTPPSLLFLSLLIISHPPTVFIFLLFFKWATLIFTFGCAGSSLTHELSLVVVSGGCSRFGVRVSLQRLLLFQGTGSRLAGFRCCSSQAPEQLAQ